MTELSTREQQWLIDTSCGYSAKQIAYHLGLSTRSVEAIGARVRAKLGAKNAAHAVARALRARHIA